MAFGLARYDLTTLTARLELPEISLDPTKPLTLILRYIGVGNRNWEAWRFARDAAAGEQDATKKTSAQRIAENRADMRDTLAAIGLAGWENTTDDNGIPVAFSADAAVLFAAELHDRVPVTLVKVMDFASTRSNFRPDPRADPADLGKG